MTMFSIHNRRSGEYLGSYLANSEADAVERMAEDAGYSDSGDMDVRTLGNWSKELLVVEDDTETT